MLYAVFGMLAAVAYLAARVLYQHAGAFNPDRFPRTSTLLGAPVPRLGAVHGAVDGVPVSVRIIGAASSMTSRDQVTVTAPTPGAELDLRVLSVPRETPRGEAPAAPSSDAFALAYAAEGHTREEVETLVPEEARLALLSLAIPDGEAPAAKRRGDVSYRDDGRSPDARRSQARAVTLRLGDEAVTLTFEARRASDAQLVAAVTAVTRCARRAMLNP